MKTHEEALCPWQGAASTSTQTVFDELDRYLDGTTLPCSLAGMAKAVSP